MAKTNRIHPSYSTKTLADWHCESALLKSDLVYPLFITDIEDQYEELDSLPDQFLIGIKRLPEVLSKLVEKGLKSVLLFGSLRLEGGTVSNKDNVGTPATRFDSPVYQAIRSIKQRFPALLIIADVCLCAYTDHGHCGVLNSQGKIDNEKSIKRLSEVARFYAEAGAHVVAPSDMMDGRIAAIKSSLAAADLAGEKAVMSYSSKFASSFYGPFRTVCNSSIVLNNLSPSGESEKNVLKDRNTYQIPPTAADIAVRASLRDEAEGADFLMVKPGIMYLDILQRLKELVKVPLAVYQVSGEYCMLYHGAKAGCFDLQEAVMESLVSFKRAGARIIITYFTPMILEALNKRK